MEIGHYKIGKNPQTSVRAFKAKHIEAKRCDVSPCGDPAKYIWRTSWSMPGDWAAITPSGEIALYSDAAFRRSTGANT